MLVLEKKLAPGSTVSIKLEPDGVQVLRVHSPRPAPVVVREEVLMSPADDEARVLDYVHMRSVGGNPVGVRELRDRLRELPHFVGVTRERFELALASLKRQGKVIVHASKGGRGVKSKILPNVVVV